METTLVIATAVKSPYPALLKCNCQAEGRSCAGGRGLEEHEVRLCTLHAYYNSLGGENAVCPVGFRSKSATNFVSRFHPPRNVLICWDRERQTSSDEQTSFNQEGDAAATI
jgi:hypothetical protein